MAKILTSLRALMTRATQTETPPVVEVEADQRAAADELTAAERGAAEAETNYRQGLVVFGADLDALDAARRAAQVRLDRASALVALLEERAAAAREAEDLAETARLASEADRLASDFRHQVENDLPLITRAVRGMLHAWAEAELARAAANARLPEEQHRLDVEAFRTAPGRPEHVLRGEVFEAWCTERGDLAPNHEQVRAGQDGVGRLYTPGTSAGHVYEHRRQFERVEYLAAESGYRPDPLAALFAVPGLTGIDVPGWSPMRHTTPREVLDALFRLDRQPDAELDTRQPRIAVRPLGPVLPIEKVAHRRGEAAA